MAAASVEAGVGGATDAPSFLNSKTIQKWLWMRERRDDLPRLSCFLSLIRLDCSKSVTRTRLLIMFQLFDIDDDMISCLYISILIVFQK